MPLSGYSSSGGKAFGSGITASSGTWADSASFRVMVSFYTGEGVYIYKTNYNSGLTQNKIGTVSKLGNKFINANGSETTLQNSSYSFSDHTGLTAYLFAASIYRGNTGVLGTYEAFPCRFYSAKISQNSAQTRDFIPVLDWDKKPAMYDRKNNQLYYNQGTGEDFKTNLDE